MYLKHVITAGILSAALALGPGAAFAQTSSSHPNGSSQGSSSQGSSSTTASPSGSSSTTTSPGSSSVAGSQSGTTASGASSAQHQGSGASGGDQEAVRQHLSAAREALAELTKLPAASQLQGDQRQRVAQLITDFNSFATANTDWRSKYDTVDHELDQILGLDNASASMSGTASASPAGVSGSASASTGASSGATSANASTTGTGNTPPSGAVGTSGSADASSLDPAIVAKLREVRTHLDQFEEASGDPTFVVEKIEKILDEASLGASGSGAVGTSGTTPSSDGSASAGGSVTLTAAQVQELRRQLDTIKAAAKR